MTATLWQQRYAEADACWDDALARWREKLGIEPLHRLRHNIEYFANEYRLLVNKRAQAAAQLKTERRSRQLNKFLDSFLIKGDFSLRIGPAKIVVLCSFGIESQQTFHEGRSKTYRDVAP